MIEFNRPPYVGTEIKYIKEAIENRKISGSGPFIGKCEEWLEKQLNVKRVLLTSSCSSALDIAARLCEIQPGDEVILPSYTFPSMANSFASLGARLVFVDIRPDTMNIDEKLIENAITERTKVLCVFHYAGVSCEMDEIIAIAHKYNLKVVEDAAQSLFGKYKGRALGTIGNYGCLSFHETKNLSMGEGGALIINDTASVSAAEIIREKGTNRSQYVRGEIEKYNWVSLGDSYVQSDLNAAYLWAQMEQADCIQNSRMNTWNRYCEGLKDLQRRGLIELPVIPEYCIHNAHLFYIKCRDADIRQSFISYMKHNEINCAFHYVPLHTSPAGLQYGEFVGEDKYTTRESSRLVRLPLYYGITDNEIERVLDAVISFFDMPYKV